MISFTFNLLTLFLHSSAPTAVCEGFISWEVNGKAGAAGYFTGVHVAMGMVDAI